MFRLDSGLAPDLWPRFSKERILVRGQNTFNLILKENMLPWHPSILIQILLVKSNENYHWWWYLDVIYNIYWICGHRTIVSKSCWLPAERLYGDAQSVMTRSVCIYIRKWKWFEIKMKETLLDIIYIIRLAYSIPKK